jgi:predicted metalloprotease with PDZ domain
MYRYKVRFPAPLTHYAEVEALFPTGSAESLELFMAVWTPGSYLVREYARNLECLAAFGESGEAVIVEKSRKNRWVVRTGGIGIVRVTYRVYCHELSVRTNWVDERFALLQGAATFLSVAGRTACPHEVELELPESWTAYSGTFSAPDYDTLADSPILAGNPLVQEFEVDGKQHLLVTEGDCAMWDHVRAVADVEKIVREQRRMWGSLPYDRYVFLNILVDGAGRGGLEHKSSCCVIGSRHATRTRAAYISWLELVSHEFFHTWNVKRLRPVELGPFDYENENYTRSLWIAEGFTEYYGGLILARAGITTPDEYLAGNGTIERLQTTPGRLAQSVEMASFDAWIKLYRPDENTVNTAISYYVKGAVIAFLYDARLRAEGRTLDEAMRELYGKYSGERGFPTDAIDDPWLRTIVEGTDELDYSQALDFYGLRFDERENAKPWLGWTTKAEKGQVVVATVPRGTPAYEAGFSADDEIVGIDGYRVLPDQLTQRLEQFRPGERLAVLVARGGRLTTVDVTLAEEPRCKWILERRPDATAEQIERLNAWLGQTREP